MEHYPTHQSGWLPVAAPSLTREQKYWLFRQGALTAGLRQLGHVDLRVLREHSTGLSADDASLLGLAPGTPIWVREITMAIDQATSVVARSFTPLRASHGCWQGMRRLRTQPLADMLYHNPQITRSRFLVRRLNGQHPPYATVRLVLGEATPPAHTLLARCSIFWRQRQPLFVAECFLPQFWSLAGQCERIFDRNSLARSERWSA